MTDKESKPTTFPSGRGRIKRRPTDVDLRPTRGPNFRKGALSLASLLDDLGRTFLNISESQMMDACETDTLALPDDLLGIQPYLADYHIEITSHATGLTLRRSVATTLNNVTPDQWERHREHMNSLSIIERERAEKRLKD